MNTPLFIMLLFLSISVEHEVKVNKSAWNKDNVVIINHLAIVYLIYNTNEMRRTNDIYNAYKAIRSVQKRLAEYNEEPVGYDCKDLDDIESALSTKEQNGPNEYTQ